MRAVTVGGGDTSEFRIHWQSQRKPEECLVTLLVPRKLLSTISWLDASIRPFLFGRKIDCMGWNEFRKVIFNDKRSLSPFVEY